MSSGETKFATAFETVFETLLTSIFLVSLGLLRKLYLWASSKPFFLSILTKPLTIATIICCDVSRVNTTLQSFSWNFVFIVCSEIAVFFLAWSCSCCDRRRRWCCGTRWIFSCFRHLFKSNFHSKTEIFHEKVLFDNNIIEWYTHWISLSNRLESRVVRVRKSVFFFNYLLLAMFLHRSLWVLWFFADEMSLLMKI